MIWKYLSLFKEKDMNQTINKDELNESLDTFHIVFNTMFCMSDRFSVFVTKLYDIEMPHFTYYTGISRTAHHPNASRSTSQNVRLYDDSDSSPITPSHYVFQTPDVPSRTASLTKMDSQHKSEKLAYKDYRRNKYPEAKVMRPMTSKPQKV